MLAWCYNQVAASNTKARTLTHPQRLSCVSSVFLLLGRRRGPTLATSLQVRLEACVQGCCICAAVASMLRDVQEVDLLLHATRSRLLCELPTTAAAVVCGTVLGPQIHSLRRQQKQCVSFHQAW